MITLKYIAQNPRQHPCFLYPAQYEQRVAELMQAYNCDHSDAEGIVDVEYCELGHIPKPNTHEIPHN
jgi:hypothetical protein